MASPATFYASGDGYQRGAITTDYATARAMTTPGLTTSLLRVGQYFLTPNYACYQAVLGFDTSVLPDDCTITNVLLSLYGKTAMTPAGWTMQARAAANADAVAGADLAALTLLATGADTTSGAYRNFISEAAFLSAINKSGWTYINISSSRQNAGTAPAAVEYGESESSAYAATARDPKLVVTYTEAGGGGGGDTVPLMTDHYFRMRRG